MPDPEARPSALARLSAAAAETFSSESSNGYTTTPHGNETSSFTQKNKVPTSTSLQQSGRGGSHGGPTAEDVAISALLAKVKATNRGVKGGKSGVEDSLTSGVVPTALPLLGRCAGLYAEYVGRAEEQEDSGSAAPFRAFAELIAAISPLLKTGERVPSAEAAGKEGGRKVQLGS